MQQYKANIEFCWVQYALIFAKWKDVLHELDECKDVLHELDEY